jgi:hypothetical protein
MGSQRTAGRIISKQSRGGQCQVKSGVTSRGVQVQGPVFEKEVLVANRNSLVAYRTMGGARDVCSEALWAASNG